MKDTAVSHFWVGRFAEDRFKEYFAEVWDGADETPLSRFAHDQGETWYDHDFFEYDLDDSAASIQDLGDRFSYSEQWAGELARRVSDAGLSDVNTLVFISEDQIDQPRSVQGDGYWLHYLGTIDYEI